MAVPVYWKLPKQLTQDVDSIIFPMDDDQEDLSSEVLGRMAHHGIRDPLEVLMAYKAVRSQIALLPVIHHVWPELSTPISLNFFIDSPILATKLTGIQKLVQQVNTPPSLEAVCEV